MKKDFITQNPDTLCVQAGYQPNSGDPRVPPIVQSTTFYYDCAGDMADLFDLKKEGYFYSRLGNPTLGNLEEKVAVLEGGVGALACSSGQSANLITVLNLLSAGDHMICSQTVYGGTFNLFAVTLKRFGIEVSFVPPDADEATLEAQVKDNTRLLFGETVANPAVTVLNFDSYGAVAKRHGIVFAVDNTLASPVFCNPLALGAHIVTHSSTKYLDGHATSVGGIVVDGGNFPFLDNPRYPDYNTPDESYHGLVYARDCGKGAFITKARVQLMRDLGAIMSPMNAFLTNLGTETLALRMERTASSALRLAKALSELDDVAYVRYPLLETGDTYALAKKYLKGGAGGMISFSLKGGRDRAVKFMESLKLFAIVTHVADLRSCVLHPASTTHRQMSDEQLAAAGVDAGLIRLSVGIENTEDILRDVLTAVKESAN